MNTAIIVAAGTGTRFGGDTPKQFRDLHGKSVLFHTIDRFQNCNSIDSIVLVLAEERLDHGRQFCGEFAKITAVVPGGPTRAESVKNGLDAVSEDGIVAIHDGARPLVTLEEIKKTVESAEEFGAACLVMPVADTIKRVSNGKIVGTIPRETLRRAATPQCFRRDLIRKAFESGYENVTDECMLVEKMGIQIAIVEGSARNIKLTFEDDLETAAGFIKHKDEIGLDAGK